MKKKVFKMKIACLLCLITAIQTTALSQYNYWNTSGNAGTNPAGNYLGTRDNKDLVLRTNALQRMYIKANGNIGIGISNPTQKLDVGGNIDIASGYSLYLGGSRILSALGSENLFLGYRAGESNGGFHNTIIGFEAGPKNSGANNTFCGHYSGHSNTYGTYNTFYGLNTGYFNTTGDGNSLFGQSVLFSNVSGSSNCSFGFEAGNYTTTSYNCFYGVYAGLTNTTGSQNTYIGYSADANGANYSNSSCLGYTSQLTALNQVRLGNIAVTSIGGYAGWTNVSDGRFKSNIKENVPGLEFIKQLNPVTYTLGITGIDTYLHKDQPAGDKKSNAALQEDIAARKVKEKIVYTGFVAQDVEKVAKKLGFDFSGVDAPKNDKDLYGLRYAEFVVPLVKAVQELAAQNDALKDQLAALQTQIDQLRTSYSSGLNASSFGLSKARLEQNSPNPFSKTTSIKYYLPETAKQARVLITDVNGKKVKEQNISSHGNGQITMVDEALSPGVYTYTLYVDGKIIESKKMIFTK